MGGLKTQSYENKLKKFINSIESVSIGHISSLMCDNNVVAYFEKMGANDDSGNQCENYFELIRNLYQPALEVLSKEEINSDYLQKNHEPIKAFLDAIKELQWFLRMLLGSGNEINKDDIFYGEFLPLYDKLEAIITPLYNKVRNFVTKKAYSVEKFKINFNCSSFLSGWANTYKKSGGLIFQKNGQYYLGISTSLSKEEIAYLEDGNPKNIAQRIVYNFQKVDAKNAPRLFISSKKDSQSPAIDKYNLPFDDTIKGIYKDGKFKTEYRNSNPEDYKRSLTKMIEYYKKCFSLHESYSIFNFDWKES